MSESTAAEQESRYQSYLVTCWQERDEAADTVVWRFRLERARNGQRRVFTNLEEMMSAIESELDEAAG